MADRDLQRAVATIKRYGEVGLTYFFTQFSKIRHFAGMELPPLSMLDEARWRLEKKEEWHKWAQEIPEIVFDPGWKIRMRPPTVGAIVRFEAEGISVYLDCYGRLGCVGEPYWEIHPSPDGDCERFLMNDVEGLVDGLRRSIAARTGSSEM